MMPPRAVDYVNEHDMWADLETGRIRAAVFAEAARLRYVAHHRSASFEPADPFDFPILPETGYFLRKDDHGLKALVDGQIQAIKREGVLAAILDRFGYPSTLALPPEATAQGGLEP
jgi:ABC-type amino acid transport substrate-binding protein